MGAERPHQPLQINLVDLSNDDAPNENQEVGKLYTIELFGPPKPMPGPTFMAWMKNGSLIRRVVNKAEPEISRLRKLSAQYLADYYGVPPEAHPVFPCGPLTLSIFFFRRPSNACFVNNNRKNKLRQAFHGPCIPDTHKPDIDNLTKFVLDVLQGVLYRDDDQVVKCEAYKFLDNKHPYEGRTIVQVSPFQEWHIPVNLLQR